MTATEAARRFAGVLSRAGVGDEIEVTRSGVPVAVIGPPKAHFVSAERFREIMATAPSLDDDFAKDVRALRAELGPAGS